MFDADAPIDEPMPHHHGSIVIALRRQRRRRQKRQSYPLSNTLQTIVKQKKHFSLFLIRKTVNKSQYSNVCT